ncbi:hypothetical protein AAFN60_04145 [Roseibacillus persicicus]|uniref:hypothetical protein n=1 Tax=Roseibacillus persicicus TaxID=454148 RepID=UPI00398BB3C5
MILEFALLSNAEETKDPFAYVNPAPVDRTGDQKSDRFVTDSILEAFGEERLDTGTGKGRALIRITVLRSFHAPLMFKWYPAEVGKDSFLQVKRVKLVVNDKRERIYQGLDLDQILVLRPSQERLLTSIYSNAPLQSLPQAYWTPEALDGSRWMYEAAAEDGSIIIVRRNPIDPSLEGVSVEKDRLSHELQLTSFAMMLWTLSGVDEEPY